MTLIAEHETSGNGNKKTGTAGSRFYVKNLIYLNTFSFCLATVQMLWAEQTVP